MENAARVVEHLCCVAEHPAEGGGLAAAGISALLDRARALPNDAPLGEQIAYHEHKARLLSRVAADRRSNE